MLTRRWPLFAAGAACVFGLEALFYLFVHVRASQLYATLVAEPLLITVVIVYVGCDARDVLPTPAERWSRIVERAWAVIIVDVGLTIVNGVGFGAMQEGDPVNVVLGTLVLFLGAMLIYAEPYLCLNDEAPLLAMIPLSIVRSMMLAWVNMSRVFSLFALELAVAIADLYLEQLCTHWFKTAVWADFVFWTIANVPLSALFAVAYLDTLSQERKITAP
ncbi:MAG TPA: hypothetical protein VFA29_03880 [Candidatus Baltobacteraceae bacterium]|nr:hypothetical protein [Candidatus Baltobacteraceae bacterium]